MTAPSDARNEHMVTTHDGREVSNYSEEWRHECEALAILAMPDKKTRQIHLWGQVDSVKISGKWQMKTTVRGILHKRGEAEVKRLEKTILSIWRSRK